MSVAAFHCATNQELENVQMRRKNQDTASADVIAIMANDFDFAGGNTSHSLAALWVTLQKYHTYKHHSNMNMCDTNEDDNCVNAVANSSR
jgi:hypothetical protein